jgi:hypothetical protein
VTRGTVPIAKHIEEPRRRGAPSSRRTRSRRTPTRKRLAAIEVELDQCWDLLRQRRAKREFGDNPDEASVRPPDIVENYEQ